MTRNTRLPGHGLQSEGASYEWHDGGEGPRWERSRASSGVALCSCGATSDVLPSNGARKRWHAAHKDEIRRAGGSDA